MCECREDARHVLDRMSLKEMRSLLLEVTLSTSWDEVCQSMRSRGLEPGPEPFRPYEVWFECRTPGPEIERGSFTGFWNGDVDVWGKHTWIAGFARDGFSWVADERAFYLFPHEIIRLKRSNSHI